MTTTSEEVWQLLRELWQYALRLGHYQSLTKLLTINYDYLTKKPSLE